MKLVKAEWIEDAPLAEVHKMRQDLPEEAFAMTADLVKLDAVEGGKRNVASLSYAWHSAAHPDPQDLIAGALKARASLGSGVALFWDHKSLLQ